MTEPAYQDEQNVSNYYYYDNDDYPISNWCDMSDISRLSATFTSILYSLIFLLSLFGNSLVLWIITKYENLMSLTNLFIMNLCITDLAFSCTLPFLIVYSYHGWIFGDFLCKAVNVVFSISYYGGVIFLTIMTILRFLAVVDPLSTLRMPTRKVGTLVCLAIWTSSTLVVVPEMIYTQITVDSDDNLHCEYIDTFTWKLVEMCQQIFFFLVSFIIIAICYIKMLKILLRSRSHRRHRTVRLIFAIVVVFFLSWAPYNMLGFMYFLSSYHLIKLSCQTTKHVFFAFDISRKIAFCHCCLNPVLYVFVGVKFRRHLKLLCKQYSPCRTQPSSPRSSSFHANPYEDASLY
ncbi:chemokine XC receptor 1 [Tiliqua scincoides]|uniref:chemokine XC receptor 1 n=1 Tax=Tiliqua scincoides TaxID=71010 RepID=UPI0034625649